MNEFFTERAEAQSGYGRDRRVTLDMALSLDQPLTPFEVLKALATYPGIDGPVFDNATVACYEKEGDVMIKLDDLTGTEYYFGSTS